MEECPFPEVRAEFAKILGELRPTLDAIARLGGGPGSAAIVLTSIGNAPWFYGAGEAPFSADVLALPADSPVTLARRMDALLPRVRAVCPACARVLLETPSTHLPVYLRIGPEGQAFTGEVLFPPELVDVARAARLAARGRLH